MTLGPANQIPKVTASHRYFAERKRHLSNNDDEGSISADRGGDNPSDEMPDADNEDHNNLMEGESSDNVINESIDDGDASISVSDEEAPGRLARTRLGRYVRARAMRNQ